MKKISIYPDTTVYIACPANVFTGGPEALHQLCFHLRNDLGVKSFIYYFDFNPKKFEKPVPPEFEFYNNPYITEISEILDTKRNILVVPEIKKGFDILSKFNRIRKVIWWLSVDNFYCSHILSSKRSFFLQRLLNKISRKLVGYEIFDITELITKNSNSFKTLNDYLLNQVDFHLAQSFYALNWLINVKRIPTEKVFYLSEYLNPAFLTVKTDLNGKENICAYNPKKGFKFTKQLISYAKDIEFIPIANMKREEVIKTLQRSKVYIDFGHHPGKDRIPREAAILGCCIITGKKGSANFYEDLPIPLEYKIEDKKENIPSIIAKIKECFENYDTKIRDFETYRRIIYSERTKFIEDLKNAFLKQDD